ncbi:CBS domain-containing protein [Reichenbachiella agarivorans]|uniref:CBS domain-containing protein n=1 Tax=Reichenbachiella agarivorans TaxID=2979464 RepID=A0ABY6CT47_9BACT|nr:CBS domain-containing protein [Reichenbachiella agarivorans]UXP33701.1 CBS domain-containing protein [Reichenbachiella agarivorans]
MIARDLINYTIPPLKPSDKVSKAKRWMNEFHIHELPVVQNGEFVGIFNENLLFDQVQGAHRIEEFHLLSAHLHVDQNEHYYEVLKRAYEASSNIVAVLNEEKKYIGCVTIQDVVEAFSKMSAINSPGTIIVASMSMSDYSMAEISRIVESEGGKILSSFIENANQAGMIRLTLKLNLENGSNIISSLQRFGYKITSIYGKGEESTFEKERLDTLMRYLKV